MNFIALLWADQSLLCTLAPFSIILSLVLGKYMLKEVIHIQQYISVGLMIIGSILSMFFTSKNKPWIQDWWNQEKDFIYK